MVDLREKRFLVVDGEVERGDLVIWSIHRTRLDAQKAMKKKISESNSLYLIVEVKDLSDDYRKNFQLECDIEIAKKQERIRALQEEISDLKKRKENNILNE